MENFDTKLRESDFLGCQAIPLPEEEQHMKPYNTMQDDEDFPFEVPSHIQSKTTTTFFQDFQHLDPQFPDDDGLSSNHHLLIDVPTTAYNDPFEPYTTYGCSSTTHDVNIYNKLFNNKQQQQPFGDYYNNNMNGGHGHMMDNFQSRNNNINSYFSNIPYQGNVFDHHHHHVTMGSDQSNTMMMITFDYPEIIKPVNFVMPDEVSCVSTEKDCHKKMGLSKNKAFSTRKSWKGRKKPSVVKGQWTIEEDRILVQLVEQYGLRKWSHIAQMLPGRIGKQCRERWHNHLRPDIKEKDPNVPSISNQKKEAIEKDTWSEEEDKVLIEAHTEIGNKWAEIAKRLPGRTENSIKNHWNATKRRQFSKRKCRSKHPRPSLLQDYIRSLNLDASSSSSSNATRDRRREKEKNTEKQEVMDTTGNERAVPEIVFSDEDFGFDEQLLEEGCSIDSLLDDIPQ